MQYLPCKSDTTIFKADSDDDEDNSKGKTQYTTDDGNPTILTDTKFCTS